MYCENCKLLYPGSRCPACGSTRGRMPQGDDLCFLVQKEALWAGMLEDVLQDHQIPFITQNKLGAGMALKVGPMMEQVSFYVPEERYEEAKDILLSLFPADMTEE